MYLVYFEALRRVSFLFLYNTIKKGKKDYFNKIVNQSNISMEVNFIMINSAEYFVLNLILRPT